MSHTTQYKQNKKLITEMR